MNALKKRMRGRAAPREDAATFDLLTERWRQRWLDPRLVESWTYEPDAAGVPRLVCTMGFSDGVRAEVPPLAEKRVAIGGKLDEVQISRGGNMSLSFPVDRHRGVVDDKGTATVYAMMPSALKLLRRAGCRASAASLSRLSSAGGNSGRWCSLRSAAAGRTTGTMSQCSCSGERTPRA